MRNGITACLSLLCSIGAHAQPALSERANRFDGNCDVRIYCPFNSEESGAKGYTFEFPATVVNGELSGSHGEEGSAGSLHIEGPINSDGTAELHARGRTNNPDYAVNKPSRGSCVHVSHQSAVRRERVARAAAWRREYATSRSKSADSVRLRRRLTGNGGVDICLRECGSQPPASGSENNADSANLEQPVHLNADIFRVDERVDMMKREAARRTTKASRHTLPTRARTVAACTLRA